MGKHTVTGSHWSECIQWGGVAEAGEIEDMLCCCIVDELQWSHDSERKICQNLQYSRLELTRD